MDLYELAKLAGAATAVAAAGVGLWRVIARALRWLRGAALYIRKLGRAADEVLPNGGSSLSDVVRRVELEVARLTNQQFVNSHRWRALHDEDPRGLFECDADGGLTWANATFCRMVARQLPQVLGLEWLNAVCEDERAEVLAAWDLALERGIEFQREVRFGDQEPRLVRATQLVDGQERRAGLAGQVVWLPPCREPQIGRHGSS